MSGNDGEYIFEFRQNGLIFIRGEQVDDNKEVYRLFKEFIEGDVIARRVTNEH